MNEQGLYAGLLAGLEAKRDELTSAINVIRREMGLALEEGGSKAAGQAPSINVSTPTGNNAAPNDLPSEIRSDTFFGMKIPDAIRLYLSMKKSPQRAVVISKALVDGGLQHTSKNWVGTVQTTLTRMKGEVAKLPNGWGLVEWYPGRSLDKTPKPAVAAPSKKKVRAPFRKATTATGEPRRKPKAKSGGEGGQHSEGEGPTD
jgi:hypothetical protein